MSSAVKSLMPNALIAEFLSYRLPELGSHTPVWLTDSAITLLSEAKLIRLPSDKVSFPLSNRLMANGIYAYSLYDIRTFSVSKRPTYTVSIRAFSSQP